MHRFRCPALALWVVAVSAACSARVAAQPPDDWYYPAEEPAQRATLQLPAMRQVGVSHALLARSDAEPPVRVDVGGEFHGWRLVETLSAPEPMAILEREFDRWGLILFLGQGKVVAEVRKAVGRLEEIHGPQISFPESYAKKLMEAKEDLLADQLLATGADPSYPAVAALLPPLEDPGSLNVPHDTYTFLGTPEYAWTPTTSSPPPRPRTCATPSRAVAPAPSEAPTNTSTAAHAPLPSAMPSKVAGMRPHTLELAATPHRWTPHLCSSVVRAR